MSNKYWTGYKGPISYASGAVNADYVLVQRCASVATDAATARSPQPPRRSGAQAIFPQVDLAFGSKTKEASLRAKRSQSSVRTKQDWIASSLRSSQ